MLFEQTRVRVLGVCFGHQVIGRALGVEVKRNEKGWEAGVLPVPLLPRGKELFGGRDSLVCLPFPACLSLSYSE